jgi:membrane protease YdiL (CAAX protease family)
MDLLVDRPRPSAALALAGTWLAFVVAVGLAVPQPPAPVPLALGALTGAVLVLAGFAATSRWRPIPAREPGRRLGLGALSVLIGALVGAVLLGLLVASAHAEPALRARFVDRLGEPLWRPVALGVESSILEEVAFRLFVFGLVTWAVSRLARNRRAGVVAGLVVSTLLFAAVHLPAWAQATTLSVPLVTGVLVLNGLAGLAMGLVFLRWGLPYAILTHIAADVVVQTFAPRLLG